MTHECTYDDGICLRCHRAEKQKSKKIWRISLNPPYGEDDATVVPDSLCRPVKEAMALCKAAIEWHDLDKNSKYRLSDAVEKYLAAVERMKKKAGKKV